MKNQEAKTRLAEELERWRESSHSQLASLVAQEPECVELIGEDGSKLYVEIQVVWDDKPAGNVRVIGSIDDGGLRAFYPLTDSFIMAPDGAFIDEGLAQ